jgi:hypothetical protein
MMRTRFRAGYFLILLLLALLALASLSHAEQPSKRLILKDGSYQPAVKWEVKGARVRYYSAERFEWEEVPTSLVDWPATEKWNKERESGAVAPRAREVDAEEQAERKAEEDRAPQVAPGLRLPAQGGVFLLDTWRDQPQLIELVQNGSEINKQTGTNIIRSTINPLAGSKQSIELKGLHARVQAHVPQPVMYFNIDLDDDPKTGPARGQDRYRIVRLQSKKDVRVVGNLKIAIYGKVKQEATSVPTTVEPLSGGWLKVTPATPLAPGEYAVVEMLGEEGMNLFVWDFGINPSAPENAAAWKPAPVQENKTGTQQTPVLREKRP